MTTSLMIPRVEAPQSTAAQAHRRSVSRVRTIDASDTDQIQATFERKVPFIIENADQNPHGVDLDFLAENYPDQLVTCFNPESNSEHIQLDDLVEHIKAGEKYRLRADVVLGRCLDRFFDTDYFDKIRGYAVTLMDLVLHFFAK